jgi:hypothetical protein
MIAQAAGQIALRFGIAALYRRWSLRHLLIVNALLLVLALAGFVVFTRVMNDIGLGFYLFAFGALQSIMLSTLSALCFSGIPHESAGQATTISAVTQRFALAVGIALSAFTLQWVRPDGQLRAHDFVLPFIGLAVLQSLCLLSFRAMQENDGSDIAARR